MDTLFFKNMYGTNPFEDDPLPAAHYHPSLQKHLTDTEKQVNLSPKRLPKHDAIGLSSHQGQVEPKGKPSPAENDFLKKANTVLAKELPTHDTPSPGNASSRFDESWPTSERPSTIESPGEYRPPALATSSLRGRTNEGSGVYTGPSGSSSSATGTDYLAQWRTRYNKQERRPHQNLPAEGSTLAKYIQRFRYSEPKSRQERDREKQVNEGSDFWWMAPPSRTSTPTDDNTRISARRPAQGVGTRGRGRGGIAGRREPAGSFGRSTPSVSPSERADTDTDDLQTRAERLLERSESTILSEPAISSEGVGFSSASSNHQEPDYVIGDRSRPAVRAESFCVPPPMGAGHQPSNKAVLRPEDDILQQWRVRRRLEDARRQTVRHYPLTDVCRETELEKPQHGSSHLEGFRKCLQQQQLLSQARPGTLQTLPLEPVTKTVGTSPMPQTIATQTNGVLPSAGEEVPVRDKRTAKETRKMQGKVSNENALREPVATSRLHIHNLDDIYARPARDVGYQPDQKSKEHRLTHDLSHEFASDKNEAEPIVASPNIRQTAGHRHSILPHLHLACDIIPCPEDRRTDRELHRDDLCQEDDFVIDERRSGPVGNVLEHIAKDSGERSSVFLQTASQHPIPSRRDPSSSDGARINQKPPEEETDHRCLPAHPPAPQNSHLAKSRADAEDARVHPDISQRGGTRDDDLRQRLDFGREVAGCKGRARGSQDRMMPSVVCEEDPLWEGDDDEEEEEGKDAGGGTPSGRVGANGRVSASSPIGAAVGQVVSDRLFTTPNAQSIPSPQSSIDSLPSMHSSLTLQGSENSFASRGEHIQGHLGDEAASSSSDGEEFADDELLQLLRRQREQYENQLQTLDRLIETQTVGM